MKPVASILILTYNRLAIVKDYLPKICERVPKNAEILIWDNASTDGTRQWVCNYAKRNSTVKTYVFQGGKKNYGVEAINFLAEFANSEYIIKVDSDIRVPNNFVGNLVRAYKEVNNPKLMFLAYDMHWGAKTFATRWGIHMYEQPRGENIRVTGGKVLLTHDPSKWMVNGACRLSRKDNFLKYGRHPKGAVYGVDVAVSKQAARHGFYVGYYTARDIITHCPIPDSKQYRALKSKELRTHKAPLTP